TVPSVANYIIHAGGGNGLLQRVTLGFNTAVRSTSASAGYGAGRLAGRMADGAENIRSTSGYIAEGYKSGGSGNSDYMKDKIAGNK
ncbi:MAG: conjugative transposon protein TraJ, partial [Bacteroidota bacterium]